MNKIKLLTLFIFAATASLNAMDYQNCTDKMRDGAFGFLSEKRQEETLSVQKPTIQEGNDTIMEKMRIGALGYLYQKNNDLLN